jgi:hypothetical protein
MYPVPPYGEISEKNVPAWFKTDATCRNPRGGDPLKLTDKPEMMYDVLQLNKEPPCQLMSGLINLKIFDAEMRTDFMNICPRYEEKTKDTWSEGKYVFGAENNFQGATLTPGDKGDFCLPRATWSVHMMANKKTYTLGPDDNPTGGNFRKRVTDQAEFSKLADTNSAEYKNEVVEVPADLSLGLMGPYRIHNAGARKKTEKTAERDCAPMDRMFSRIMLIPITKNNDDAAVAQRTALLAKVQAVKDKQTARFAALRGGSGSDDDKTAKPKKSFKKMAQKVIMAKRVVDAFLSKFKEEMSHTD